MSWARINHKRRKERQNVSAFAALIAAPEAGAFSMPAGGKLRFVSTAGASAGDIAATLTGPYRDQASLLPSEGGDSYHASAVHFNSTNMINAEVITAPATSPTLLIAGWFGNMGYGNMLEMDVLGPGNVLQINTQYPLGIQFYGKNAEDETIFDLEPVYDLVNVDTGDLEGWHSIAVSVDTATQTIQVYIDRVSMDVSEVSWFSSDLIKLHGDIGAGAGSAFYANTIGPGTGEVDVSNWIASAGHPFFDLSVPANLDKLFSATNAPVSWGADGSLVTGSQPVFFFSGNAADYANQLGYGGPFTLDEEGTLTDADSSPSGEIAVSDEIIAREIKTPALDAGEAVVIDWVERGVTVTPATGFTTEVDIGQGRWEEIAN